MGDNQPTGPLDLDEAASRFDAFTAEENEREEPAAEEDADPGEESEEESPEDGEPESDDEPEDEEAELKGPDKTYTVKVDGKEFQVTERELLSGYQRQADYTRKSMALAEERKAGEAELNAVRGERQQLAQWAQQMLAKLQREAPVEPDWDQLRVSDPIGFGVAWAQHQRYREQQAVLAQQYEQVMAKNREDEQKALSRTIAAESERLTLALPEWKDEAKAEKEKQALLTYGRKAGFSDEELATVYDHRTVLVLRKAMLYDRILAKRPQVAAARSLPQVAPPTAAGPARNGNSHHRAMQRLAKSGSIEDAAAAFERFV